MPCSRRSNAPYRLEQEAGLQPETNRADILRRLIAEGWSLARHGSGHDIYVKAGAVRPVVLPRHRTLSIGVARDIYKAAGW